MKDSADNRNIRAVRLMVIVAVAMFGFGYALVPIYNVLCKVTGLNGKIGLSANKEIAYQVDYTREISIEFVTTLNEGAPMLFRSEVESLKVHPGEYHTVNFYAENKTNKILRARAIPSVSPGAVADFLKKTQCFCFTEQVFNPQEGKVMPVRFVVEPKIPNEYKVLTLAYTFFDNTETSTK